MILKLLQALLDDSHCKRVIICGHINVNLLCDGNLSQNFKCHIQTLGLHQIRSTPTRITPTSVSLLDLMIADNPASVVELLTLHLAIISFVIPSLAGNHVLVSVLPLITVDP